MIIIIKAECITVTQGKGKNWLIVCICISSKEKRRFIPEQHEKIVLIILMNMEIMTYALIVNMLISDI